MRERNNDENRAGLIEMLLCIIWFCFREPKVAYCEWDKISELYKRYHDEEWGIPVHDDRTQFEFLMLEAMQCGLSWKLMLQKREIFRKCFDNFEYDKVARYTESDVSRIMNTDGMIKSRRKIKE